MQQFKKRPWVRSNEMFKNFCPKIFCFTHLSAIRTSLVLIFKNCVCHFVFITICYPGAKQSQWHKTFTQVPKMFFEFNVGSFHHLSETSLSEARKDYKELTLISLLHMGRPLSSPIPIYAYHHPRLMAKIIYTIKIAFFTDQLKVSRRCLIPFKILLHFCLFSIEVLAMLNKRHRCTPFGSGFAETAVRGKN